jgi:hypothetical protein
VPGHSEYLNQGWRKTHQPQEAASLWLVSHHIYILMVSVWSRFSPCMSALRCIRTQVPSWYFPSSHPGYYQEHRVAGFYLAQADRM